jgi:hypothetical protein
MNRAGLSDSRISASGGRSDLKVLTRDFLSIDRDSELDASPTRTREDLDDVDVIPFVRDAASHDRSARERKRVGIRVDDLSVDVQPVFAREAFQRKRGSPRVVGDDLMTEKLCLAFRYEHVVFTFRSCRVLPR